MKVQARMHYPVAIIGSGPTGLMLSNLLGRMGIRALLVERNEQTVQEPRAVSIDDESLRSIQAAGAIDDVLTQITPGYGSHYYSPRGRCFTKVEPTGTPYGYPRRNAFRQPILEGQLRNALGRFDCVETLFGWRLVQYERMADRMLIRLQSPRGETREMECDYLVGCDGANSTVREQQGVALEGTTFNERWLIVDLEDNENTVTYTKVFCDWRRPCITLPGPARTRRFEFKLLPHEMDADLLAPNVVDRLLAAHGADPRAAIRRKVVYRFHARVAPRWSFDGRVFLAGDAAHLTPPFAGQGMNSGIRDAHNLSWKLAAVIRGQLGPRVLESYERERSDHVWQMIHLALRMGRVMSPATALSGFLTWFAFLFLNLWPHARNYVAQMKYKPPPRFHDGFMLPDGRGRRASLVGRLLLQPHVITAEGRTVLLDEVLGNRFAVLVRSAQPEALFEQLRHPIWDRLMAARIAVLPCGTTIREIRGVTVVAEVDSSLDQSMAPYAGCALLLRPDHYVAAAIELPDADAERVSKLVEATWNAEELPSLLKAGPGAAAA
jgi:3-(3-hydroxy-phenyl)propionate hydroxylase